MTNSELTEADWMKSNHRSQQNILPKPQKEWSGEEYQIQSSLEINYRTSNMDIYR